MLPRSGPRLVLCCTMKQCATPTSVTVLWPRARTRSVGFAAKSIGPARLSAENDIDHNQKEAQKYGDVRHRAASFTKGLSIREVHRATIGCFPFRLCDEEILLVHIEIRSLSPLQRHPLHCVRSSYLLNNDGSRSGRRVPIRATARTKEREVVMSVDRTSDTFESGHSVAGFVERET